MQYDMEDLIEQANEVQESMSRSYGVPDELDEADLDAGASDGRSNAPILADSWRPPQNSTRSGTTLPRRSRGSRLTSARTRRASCPISSTSPRCRRRWARFFCFSRLCLVLIL